MRQWTWKVSCCLWSVLKLNVEDYSNTYIALRDFIKNYFSTVYLKRNAEYGQRTKTLATQFRRLLLFRTSWDAGTVRSRSLWMQSSPFCLVWRIELTVNVLCNCCYCKNVLSTPFKQRQYFYVIIILKNIGPRTVLIDGNVVFDVSHHFFMSVKSDIEIKGYKKTKDNRDVLHETHSRIQLIYYTVEEMTIL